MRTDKDIFFAALDYTVAEERNRFVEEACAPDPVQRRRIERLLADHFREDDFLEDPAAERPTILFAAADLEPEAVGTMIGPYKILEKVGEGGCGVVYVAEQTAPIRRRVAIKVIKIGMDTKSVIARFEAERQALAMMDHPNIAKVLDAGATEKGRPFFVMELVRGVRITEYCDENRLPAKERLDLFIKVCQAIQHAHQKGIIHRDIKPSNILVTMHDGAPAPKVIDFGIAKATEGRLTEGTVYTQLHQFIGTPAYMSPEQAEMSALDIDTRSDIYSLGVLLYELLAGSTPFSGLELMSAGIDAMRRTIREEEPMRPSSRLATLLPEEQTTAAKRRRVHAPELIHLLKGDLDWIVMKCLEKDRTRRYDTAVGLAADLGRYLGDEPVLARSPTTGYRMHKAWKRHRVAIVTGFVIAISIIVGGAVSLWQAQRARTASLAWLASAKEARAERDSAEKARAQEAAQRQRAEAGEKEARRLVYVAKMNLAQQAWEQSNMTRLRDLLRETRSYPDRGFEWYFWQKQSHLDLRTLTGGRGSRAISSLEFSPDGKKILAGDVDQTPRVWDAADGRELLVLKGHQSFLEDIRFFASFSPDGSRIVSGGSDKTARIWDALSGQELFVLKGHSNAVSFAGFSPDGKWVATCSQDRTARLWDAANGREMFTLTGHTGEVFTASFSPDSRRIATAGRESPRIWEVANGRELFTLQGHSNAVIVVHFSRDGRRILTAGYEKNARIWDATDGKLLATLSGHEHWINTAAFSPDGQRVLTGSMDSTARLWDVATARTLFTFAEHRQYISSVAFSEDGKRIVTAGGDGTARIWDAVTGRELSVLRGHTGHVKVARFSPDGLQVATGDAGGDPSVKIWDARGDERFLFRRHRGGIMGVAFSSDGATLVTAGWDRVARTWEARTRRPLLVLTNHTAGLTCIAISTNGQYVATGSDDQTIHLWDIVNRRDGLVLTGHSNEIKSVAFSPDGQKIVSAGLDSTARVWDRATGRELFVFRGHKYGVMGATFSPDGKRILTGGADMVAKIWDAETGLELQSIKGGEMEDSSGFGSVAFSPDGKRFVSGGDYAFAKVWDLATGKQLFKLRGHSAQVLNAVYSPDGRRIVTSSTDQTARVWDALTGDELLILKGHGNAVRAAVFSPDGLSIVTGSDDLTARIWESATPEQVKEWSK